MADFNGRKKRMLGGFLALGRGSVAGMFFIYRGDWILASVLFILANIGANGSFVFYDALLPHIARDDEVDRVSTAGYALGLPRRRRAAGAQPRVDPASRSGSGCRRAKNLSAPGHAAARLAFLSVAVWWLVFSIPLFRRVPEPAPAGGRRAMAAGGAADPGRRRSARRDGPFAAPLSPGIPDAAGVS